MNSIPKDIDRVILARELSFKEIEEIAHSKLPKRPLSESPKQKTLDFQ